MLPTLTVRAQDNHILLNSWRGAAQPRIDSVAPSFALQRCRAFVSRRVKRKVGKMAAAAVSSSATPFSIPPPQVDTARPGTLLEALEHLQKTRQDEEEDLPQEYTVSEAERPDVRYDEWSEMGEIPVIDLSQVETDRAGIVKQLYSAAADWGFFQLINHGLILDELSKVQSEAYKFFELPAEIKQKLGGMGATGRAYIGDNTAEKGSSLHWAESLMFQKQAIDEHVGKAWPEGNSLSLSSDLSPFPDSFCKSSGSQSLAEIINKQLLELLAESLGLSTDFFSQHLNSRRTLALRMNFYPACPRPSDVLGASSHTDGCSITLLIQDKVGGLQIQKDGKWIGIKPIEGALVVNVGDTLHAWSNGTFKSVLHRSVVNKLEHRLSLAAFLNVDRELSISAPEELVDDSHPRLYRPFNSRDYAMHIVATRYKAEGSASKDGLLVLDEFKLKK